MAYELWAARQLLANFSTEAEVLAVVRRSIERHGRDSVKAWVLLYEDDEDESKDRGIAAGEDLIALAEQRQDGSSTRARTA